MELQLNDRQRKRTRQIAAVAAFGGLAFGYDTGVINGALGSLKENMGFTSSNEGLIMSFLLVGAAIGSVLGGTFADLWGRRKYLICLSVLFLAGALMSAAAPSISFLLISRFILGFAVGGASVTAPTYISEMAPTESRGKLTGMNEAFIVSGQFLAFLINAIIFIMWGHLPDVWRYMLLVQAIPALALFIGMLIAPESPRWLIKKGRKDEAFAILKTIRPEKRAEKELEDIVALSELEAKKSKGNSLNEILKTKWIIKILISGIGLAVLQQTTGINAIIYYGTEIIKSAGIDEKTALILNVFNGVSSVVAMSLGILFMVDRFKRKTIVMGGLIIMVVLHLMIAGADALLPASVEKAIIIWLLGAIFVFVMQGSLGYIVWVILAELFPLKVRGLAIGICVFCMWIANAIIAYLFPLLMGLYGLGFVFMLFAVINAISALFVKIMLPETSKKSLEQLEVDLSSGKW